MSEISEKDQAILDTLRVQHEQDMKTLRDGYRAIARFQARMYLTCRELLTQDFQDTMQAFAGRDQCWAGYAAKLGKESIEDLTDEELMRGLVEARPAWPWESDDENLSDQ